MESKVQVIRKAIQETRQRRKNQKVVVYQLKLQNLSERKQELLARVFAEAKWLYNYLVSDISRLNVPANKISTVQVKVSEAFEKRQLLVLGSQVKQEIADRLRDNLRALDKLKKKGYIVTGISLLSSIVWINRKLYFPLFSSLRTKENLTKQFVGLLKRILFRNTLCCSLKLLNQDT